MAYTAKLANPTPWEAKLDWDRGVKIRVPAFGDTTLTLAQLDDFRDGKPGSEAVQEVLNYFGLFVVDSDRPYDNQALDAIQKSHAAKKAQYDSAVRNLTDRRAASGVAPNEAALEETLKQQGLITLREKISTLAEQAKALTVIVGPQRERIAHKPLDPARTIFVMDPPREFPSVASMNFFLDMDENREVKAAHEAYNQKAQV